jgi:hypothetical protein
MKKLFEIDNSEKQRILEMHQTATKKNYLNEQTSNPNVTQEPTYRNTTINSPDKVNDFTMKNIKNCKLVDSYVSVLKSLNRGAGKSYYACKESNFTGVRMDPEEKFVAPLAEYLRGQLLKVSNLESCVYKSLQYQKFYDKIPADIMAAMKGFIGEFPDEKFYEAVGALAFKKFEQMGGKCVAQQQPRTTNPQTPQQSGQRVTG